jgi:hypothetical protein
MFPKGVRSAAGYVYGLYTVESRNPRIEFYGRVIDQDGNPIPAASVRLRYSMYSRSEMLQRKDFAPHEVEAITDKQGNFALHLSGISLELMDIKATGHQFKGEPGMGMDFQWYYEESPPPATSDPKHPIVFNMWRSFGRPEPLIEVGRGLPGGDQMTDYDVTYSVYLTGFIHSPHVKRGRFEDADLWYTQSRGPTKVGSGVPVYDYSFTLEVPRGGLAKATTAYPFEAPMEGYQRAFCYIRKADDPPAQPADLRFFLKSRDGQLYGIIDLNRAILGYVNPNGSRNLQPGGGEIRPDTIPVYKPPATAPATTQNSGLSERRIDIRGNMK